VIAPARPRKIPRQQRSIALVNALKDACLKILREEGHEALTVARLSELSGVAVVSIYEYFPNVDAVISETLLGVLAGVVAENGAAPAGVAPAPSLREHLLRMATSSVELRRRLLRLHPELYVRYIEHFESLALAFSDNPDFRIEVSIERVMRQLEPYRDEIRIDDLERAAFLCVRAVQMLTRSIAVERGAWLDDPQTPRQIGSMLYGLLT
jgi:AcrR family transcriptional regulator